MEPVKFEKIIKKQLGRREIAPSGDSWEKLEARLDQEDKKSKPAFFWIGIAAAAACIVFVVTALFNNPVIEEAPVVVDQNSEKILREESQPAEINTSLKVENGEPLNDKPVTTKKYKVTKKGIPTRDHIEKMRTKTRVATTEKESGPTDKPVTKISEPTKAIAEVSTFRKSSPVTDAEITAMLLEAREIIEKDTSLRETYAVNPAELLDDVEYELEEGFRQKVFEALKEGFSKAKTAVANRNF